MKNKESILNYDYLIDKKIVIKFTTGREVEGTLKGYDAVGNIVLDDSEELLPLTQDNVNSGSIDKKKRYLGVLFARGPNVSAVFPKESFTLIDNPFN
mmetsp:Transcript_9514/g.9844  ORF Transcript_9514/g.9844 Transcript_9514/m.9844 type:complete len:97 (+) Transcript_9514:37-327(+)